MAKQKQVNFYKSKTMRVTELDFSGRPVYGPDSVIVTNGQISTAFAAQIEEGETLQGVNGNGDICWTEPADPSFTGYTIDATFCNVDFALFEKLTGHPVVLNDDGTIVGIEERGNIKLSNVNFALELWTGAKSTDAPRAGAEGEWGYILAPFVRGGTLTDITVENAAITFGVTGMVTKSGSAWGSGPYNVELVGGEAAPLHEPIDRNAYRRIISVEIAPPEVFEGSIPLLDRADPDLTDVTYTDTAGGLSGNFAPVPAGADPVWYEFGDGTWDYAETGSYTHTYPAAGSYEVTARRGDSVVTKTVTVSAA